MAKLFKARYTPPLTHVAKWHLQQQLQPGKEIFPRKSIAYSALIFNVEGYRLDVINLMQTVPNIISIQEK